MLFARSNRLVLLFYLLCSHTHAGLGQKRIDQFSPRFFDRPVLKKSQLEQVLEDKQDEIARVVRMRYPGWNEIPTAMISAASSATEIAIRPETRHPWVAIRSHGHSTTNGPWIWAGKAPLKAFTFNFHVFGTDAVWTAFISECCGNFWITTDRKPVSRPTDRPN